MSFFLVSLAAAVAVGLLRSMALFAFRSRVASKPIRHRIGPARVARRKVAVDRAA